MSVGIMNVANHLHVHD